LDEQAIATVIQNKKVNTGKTKLGAMIGAYVKIGVNTSLMPGVKIGSRSCIDSGVVVSEDISDNIFYKANAPSYKKVNNRL
jgi:bifunctional UDP-N-acetylglucosamine pyrophosphorylase/glucosamine-1-phosphate N-acetyltransferase